MTNSNYHTKTGDRLVLAGYYGALVLFLLASFFPQYRGWGINWWAYFPGYVPFVLFAIGAVAPVVVRGVLRGGRSDVDDDRASADGSGKYFLIVFCLTAVFALAFYLLRARTHFLGDGYQLLSLLADQVCSAKAWDKGTSLINNGFFSLLWGEPEARALLVYRVVSIASGIGMLIATGLLSWFLFDRNSRRLIFFLGLA